MDPVIEHCNQVGQFEDVKRAFFVAQTAANLARYDSGQGEHSLFGFKALFKSQLAVFKVAYKLNGIYNYAKMDDLKPTVSRPKVPRFACVAPDTAAYYASLNLNYDPWEKCMFPAGDGSPTQAFLAAGTVYIFLCPAFFQQAVMPPPSRGSSACPVVSRNRFAGDQNDFYKDFQIYTLLYQLIRFYLGKDALGRRSRPREVFDWNLCVRFTMAESIRNPTNMLLYIAMVQQRCTSAPDPNAPPWRPPYQIAPASTNLTEESANASFAASKASMAPPHATVNVATA